MDPLPDAQRPPDESAEGVPVFWHPDVLLLRYPELAATVDRWRTGARRTIDAAAHETLTNWEIEAVLVMASAQNRAEMRRLEAMKREHADGASQGHAR